MKNLIALAAIIGIALCAVAIDLDRDGIADIIVPEYAVSTFVEPEITVAEPWALREGWRGAYDWNGDGVIDYRDDFMVGGVQPWDGEWLRADWNRDGVIDNSDGWRRFGDQWATGSWDPTWRGDGWKPETVSVREVPSGFYNDSQWKSMDGPWDSFGWGGSLVGDWNRDGVVNFQDDLAWRGGFGGAVVETPFVGGYGGRVVETPFVGGYGGRVVETPIVGGYGGAVLEAPFRSGFGGATRVF